MPPQKPPHLTLPLRSHRITKPTLPHRPFSTSTPNPATFIPRPFKVYHFTQLVTLSDGSTFTHRTTSPTPVYRSSKDARNTPKWNPSNARMANVEEDQTGRLSAFRARFGRGWDAEGVRREEEEAVAAMQAEELQQELDDGAAYPEVKMGREEEAVTVVDGVAARVEGRAGPGGKGVARPVDERLRSEWDDAADGEQGDNLVDLIGQFGRNEGRGGSQSGWHLGGQVRKPGKSADSAKKGGKSRK